MTVPEMGKLLGLKKTDRYWLVHKNVFESKEIAGKMRINIASFEKWYDSARNGKTSWLDQIAGVSDLEKSEV